MRKLHFISKKGNVELKISEDYFSAALIIKENGIISENEIIELLDKAGIKQIIEQQEIAENIGKTCNQPFLIAETVSNRELKLEYLFDVNRAYVPDKTQNLTEFNKIVKVAENVPLANVRLIKTDADKQYYDVFGNSVEEDEVKERLAQKYISDQLYYSRENSRIYAKKRGYPYLKENDVIAIKTKFESDENLYKLSLNFNGDLIINGDIENCSITVSGNLTVNGNIINCWNAGIVSQANLQFSSALNSYIGAGGNINFAKSVRFCYLFCDGMIKGGEQSVIIGGTIRSSEGIIADNAGGFVPINTRLEITILPFIKEELRKITQKFELISTKKRSDDEIPDILIEKQKMIENTLEKAYKLLLSEKYSKIIIRNTLYKDTDLKIYNKFKQVTNQVRKAEIILNKQGIQINES